MQRGRRIRRKERREGGGGVIGPEEGAWAGRCGLADGRDAGPAGPFHLTPKSGENERRCRLHGLLVQSYLARRQRMTHPVNSMRVTMIIRTRRLRNEESGPRCAPRRPTVPRTPRTRGRGNVWFRAPVGL
ncbi:hypothetical protein DPEC_G00327950 [Dallia pectoralis]|uniref:Uncharacterized protein n=1 Tax=Dallia pectoralis TaxID=75939 RepID=A0ACC2F889_DALPE|nr:hypothetical protein DPEC_G00327950 [Dallia pectoralis]